jgi:ABC-type multidrug transport system permease subunit
MSVWKLRFYKSFAVVETLAFVVYGLGVIPDAPNSFELAVLIFTGTASIFGWITLWISWVSYRLDAARVPRPDLSIIANDAAIC